MTDTLDHNGLPDDDLLAAEYALGVLDGPERAAAQARAERDRAFARLVAAWEERLAPWAAEIGEVAPPPEVWRAIAAQLPAEPPARRAGLWENLAFWRIAALAGALAAICLAIVVFLGAPAPREPLVASLDGGGRHHFVATLDTARGSIAVVPAAFSAEPARVPELWLIPADGKPRPLGLLDAQNAVTLTLPAQLAAEARRNATLAVSLEPPGGSPTGQPTGPVIATGKLTSL